MPPPPRNEDEDTESHVEAAEAAEEAAPAHKNTTRASEASEGKVGSRCRTPPPPSSPPVSSAAPRSGRDRSASSRRSTDRSESELEEGEAEEGEFEEDEGGDRDGNEREEDDDRYDDDDEKAEARETTAALLPSEPVPPPGDDDGWVCQWDTDRRVWYFVNHFTGKAQWENPRVSTRTLSSEAAAAVAAAGPPLPTEAPPPPAGGYNPAIHGDWDPNAWYARPQDEPEPEPEPEPEQQQQQYEQYEHDGELVEGDEYAAAPGFNRYTGQLQGADAGPDRHSDEAKARRQMHSFFDVDAAANAHDGRSLRAERAGRKPSKAELKQFKERRRVRKEEKRRAWLRD